MISRIIRYALKYIPRPILIRISYLFKWLIPLFYKGSKFEDPIDGNKYRKLLPYGYGDSQRENALAPGSLSLERHRLLWLYLKNETNFFTENKKMLHIAPEQCFVDTFRKLKNIDYTTADIESPLADVLMDVQKIPFEENTFDVIFCNHVLEHVDDDDKAMKELYRVLKPGGLGIFQVPQNVDLEKTYEDSSITSPEDRTKHFGQYDHLRIYGMDYFSKLKNAGFKVNPITYANKFTPEKVKSYALVVNEILPICSK
ncbi:MAG: methyltransferase domain-containing protein [Ichthyobacteriaceae bacterium]|nr:methyltransferase domain-containing protein [Ichthyobacteriaceae bacterium]